MSTWETLDIQALLAARDAQHEDTTSANVGAYPIPIGGMLRREIPIGAPHPYKHCGGQDQFCALEQSFAEYDRYYRY